MTLDEAIQILEDIPLQKPQYLGKVSMGAIKLGIEALKAILEAREGNYASFKLLLPGETKEGK